MIFIGIFFVHLREGILLRLGLISRLSTAWSLLIMALVYVQTRQISIIFVLHRLVEVVIIFVLIVIRCVLLSKVIHKLTLANHSIVN